ncbi:MAG: HEAT repeat domain-containing protein [Anaerolineae bacterium]
MGFLKRLFGGKKEEARPASKRVGTPTPRPAPQPRPEATEAPDADVAPSSAKQLARDLGSGNPERREEVARLMVASGSRTSLRPLMNCYLNYGDPGVLEALRVFGKDLAAPASREAFDLSVMGARRARLMDILGISGDESVLTTVRPNMDDVDPDIHIRSCVAVARLGDMFGIDRLEDNIRMTDPELRSLALAALMELKMERSDRVLADHVKRFMAEAGAVPENIVVKAPLLGSSETSLSAAVIAEVIASPQNLIMVIGSGGIQMAAQRRDAMAQALAGHGKVSFGLPLMSPEEQIASLQEAHAAATASPGARAIFIGRLPAPHDNPPLPHFITRVEGVTYSVKILVVDLHEYSLLQDWLHYVQDKAEAPTDIEVILSVSLESQSGLTAEERVIYAMCSAEDKARFPRAFMARS